MPKNKKKIDLSQKIMKQIKKKHVKIRPRFYFVSGSVLLGIGLTGVMMVSIFFVNLVVFKLRFHGPFDYLLFGRFGLKPFFMAFPWIPLLVALGGIIGGLFLLRRYDISYKKGFLALVIGLVILILSTGFILDSVGINKRAEKLRQLRPLYQGRFVDQNWVMGEIVEIKDQKILIVTPKGEEIKILKEEKTLLPLGSDFKEGERIRVVGEWQDDIFIAKGIGKGGFPKQMRNGEVKGIKSNKLPKCLFD